jgi:hypothetical protein
MYKSYKPFSLVINLIGSQKNIYIATNEIREYLLDTYLGYKVIENKDIDNHFNRKSIAQDIFINQCNFLSNQQLQKLHYNIENKYNYSSKKLYSSALLVRCKEYDNYIKSLHQSPLIHNVYNIEDNLKTKHNILFDIIFTNYYNK